MTPAPIRGIYGKINQPPFLSLEVLAIASMEIGIFGCYLGYLS